MQIVVITGSPHKHGSTDLLAQRFIQGAEEAGHTVERFDAAFMNIHPCLGCKSCGMNGPCVQKDDTAQIRDALLAADMSVFATPIAYFSQTGNTDGPAKLIHEMSGADIVRIERATPYSSSSNNPVLYGEALNELRAKATLTIREGLEVSYSSYNRAAIQAWLTENGIPAK